MDRILAVIPAYNRRETTLNIVENLKGMLSYGFDLDALVVDDGSTDGTGLTIRERFPDIKIEQGDGSLWWGGALNVGYKYALRNGYNYVYTLNDDNALRRDTLSELYNAAKRNPDTVCGSIVLRESGTILSAGFKYSPILGKVLNPWRNKVYESVQQDFIRCQTLSTRSTLIPIEVLKRGLQMDEKNFPHNYSDYDFFDRVRKCGFSLIVVKSSIVVAGESTSNFHYFILDHSIEQIVSSFFEKKYANNFRNQWNIASRNTNPVFAVLRFVCFVFPSVAWLFIRCLLPRSWLEALLAYCGRYERKKGI